MEGAFDQLPRKVYCGSCRWYQSHGIGDEDQPEACMAITGYADSYINKGTPQRHLGHPANANENNDCTFYNWSWFGWRGY